MFSEQGARRNAAGRIAKWPWSMLRDQASLGLRQAQVEVELSDYQRLPSGENFSPGDLLQGESSKAEAISDLDRFFERLYNYFCEKGFWCIVTQWIVELLSLGFTICFSGFFLLFVNWNILHKCGVNALEPCDLVKEALNRHPLKPFTFFKAIVLTYLALFSLHWLFYFLRFFTQLKETLEIRRFYYHSLGVTDRELQTTSWSALLDKTVQFQRRQRLCIVRELSAHDVVLRIMRKENYLIGMLNKGVLALSVPSWVPGVGPVVCRGNNGVEKRLLLTKTLEWTLNSCILQNMFDRNFLVRREFLNNPAWLRKRLMVVAFIILLLSPFLIIFMFVYFFLRHAEQFYHHPSAAASRRWSNLAKWNFREFNELDHMFKQRLNGSYKHAVEYVKQFPSPILSLIAKFVSFVTGGFAAILIIIAFLDETLLEAHLFGRNLFWYAAVFGTVTAICRSAVTEEFQVFEPEKSLRMVACYTHYMPKHWRGAENKDSVRAEFTAFFQYTSMMLLEELVSIFVTPYVLFFLLPKHVDDILQFVQDFTLHVEGVGDVCSLSLFDFEHHGNSKYGSPFQTSKDRRSSQGKMEKSFLSFKSSYPNWEPDASGKELLSILSEFHFQSQEPQKGHLCETANLSPLYHRLQGSRFGENSYLTFSHPRFVYQFPVANSQNVDASHSNIQLEKYRDNPRLWTINLEQDWLYWLVDRFYTSKLPRNSNLKDLEIDIQSHGGRDSSVDSSLPISSTHTVGPGQHDSNIDAHEFASRLNSDMDASTSSRLQGKGIVEQKYSMPNFPRQVGASHWWAREGPRIPVTQESFLEPPMFTGGHFTGSNYESSLESEDDLERAWVTKQSGGAYESSLLEGKGAGFDLPFGDIFEHVEDASEQHKRPLNVPVNRV